jgi:hypothetical protein
MVDFMEKEYLPKYPFLQHQSGIDYRNMVVLISNDFGNKIENEYGTLELFKKIRSGQPQED